MESEEIKRDRARKRQKEERERERERNGALNLHIKKNKRSTFRFHSVLYTLHSTHSTHKRTCDCPKLEFDKYMRAIIN